MPVIDLVVNGTRRRLDTDPQRSLLSVLRDDLDLTGAKYGCGEGQCGACTVLIDGQPARSCLIKVGAVAGKSVTTIEGLEAGGQLHPLQQAFLDAGAMQCGYCTPGMIMAGVGLLRRNPDPEEPEIAEGPGGQHLPLRDLPAHRRRRAGGGGSGNEDVSWLTTIPRKIPSSPSATSSSPGPPTGSRSTAATSSRCSAPASSSLSPCPRASAQESGGTRRAGDAMPGEIGAWLHIGEDGRVTVYTGKVEVGQNIRTSLAQVVAEELRVPVASIRMVMADTARAPFDTGTFGSRTTPDHGPAAPHGGRRRARGADRPGRRALERRSRRRSSPRTRQGRPPAERPPRRASAS